MASYTTSLTVIELEPNCGLKEIVVITPSAVANDNVEVTLADHGIASNGLLAVHGYTQTTTGSVITSDEVNTLTSVIGGVAVISSTLGTGIKVFRLLGKSG